MSNRFEQPLTVNLVSSRYLVKIILAMHLLAYLSLFLTNTTLFISITVSVTLTVSLISFIIHISKSRTQGPDTLVVRPNGKCILFLKSGKEEVLEIFKGHFVSPWLIIMHLKGSPNKRRSLLLLSIDYDDDLLRRLRVILRYGAIADSSSAPR